MKQVSTSRYEIRSLLGEGGLGRVFLAYDAVDGREVALKEVLGASTEDAKQEFWWMTRLKHAALPEVYHFGLNEEGRPFFTMEVVGGRELAEALPLAPDTARSVIAQMCRVLGRLHHQGLVHGDIKPENIRLLDDGTIKLLDFGMIAQAGQVLAPRGTPAYMAPEVLLSAPVDRRADLYALGVMSYQLLTGRLPFEKPSAAELVRAHLHEAPKPPSACAAGLEEAWDALVLRLLAKDPQSRPNSAAEVLEALGEAGDGDDDVLLSGFFVGRERELAVAEGALAALAARREGRTLWVTGASGVGKTRFLDEVAVRAQLADLLVLRGAPSPVASTPYEPVVQLLRQAWPALSTSEGALLESHGPVLRKLVPDLIDAPEAPRLGPEQEKLRLQGALSVVFQTLAKRRGLVLLLDNWDLADAPSRELVAALERQQAASPLLAVCASREEVFEGEVCALPPFSAEETARLVAGMVGDTALPEELLARIAQLTGGLPYAIEAFLRHLVDQAYLTRRAGAWMLKPVPPEALPSGIQEILSQRMAQVSPLGRRVLEVAAVMGREFDLALLLRLLPDADAEAVYETLASLEESQLLSRRGGHYQAAQQFLGEVLLYGLEPKALSGLHTRVAEALEECLGHAEDDDALLSRLAHHFLEGDRPAKAVMYALSAAQRASELFSNDQSLLLARRGAALLEAQPDAPAALRADYCALMGDMHRRRGDLEEAERLYREGLAHDAERPEARAHMLVGLGVVMQMLSEHDAAIETFQQALPICREHGIASEELRAMAAMGRVYHQRGDVQRSQIAYEETLARALSARDQGYEAECEGFLGLLLVNARAGEGEPSRMPEGFRKLARAIKIQETIGDKRGLNDTFMLRGNAYLSLGRLREADEDFKRNLALCQEIGAFEDEIVAHFNLGSVALDRGDAATAAARARQVRQMAGATGNHFLEGLGRVLAVRAQLTAGQLGDVYEALDASLEAAREWENGYWELYALAALIEAHGKLGRYEEGEEALLEALSVQAETGYDEFADKLKLYQGTLALKQGNLEPVEAVLREVLVRATANEAQFTEAQACVGLAELALVHGDMAEATRWLDRAEDRASASDAQLLLAECRVLRGRVAATQADMVEADGHFQRAQEIAERFPYPDLRALALFERAMLHYPSPQATALLKQAQAIMVELVETLAPGHSEPFLSAGARAAIYAAEPVSYGGPEEPADEAHQVMDQQRMWLRELQQANTLLAKQLDFSKVIARSGEATFVINQALALVLEFGRAARAEALMLEDGALTLVGSADAAGAGLIHDDWQRYEEWLSEAMSTGEPLLLPDTRAFPERFEASEPRVVLALPLADEGKRVGALLLLGHPDGGEPIIKREMEALRGVAEQLAVSLRHLRLQQEMREKTQRLEILYKLSATVSSTLDMREVLDHVLKLALEVTKAERGFLVLVEEATGQLKCEHRLGTATDDYSQSICRRVLETGQAFWAEDTLDDEVLKNQKSIQNLNLRTVLGVPIKLQQKYIGVLYVDSRIVVNAFTERDLELLKSIVNQAAIALENARLYRLATVDGLTQLYFRSFLEQRMNAELKRSQRNGTQMSVLMVDIDHFKRFNDTYGHAVGDDVLRLVAGLVKQDLRVGIDVPARYGGEEIVVMLPDTDAAGALVVAERIRHSIDSAVLKAEGHEDLHVSVSIGVGNFPSHGETLLEISEAADKALYHSKRTGRNRVTVYSAELENSTVG